MNQSLYVNLEYSQNISKKGPEDKKNNAQIKKRAHIEHSNFRHIKITANVKDLNEECVFRSPPPLGKKRKRQDSLQGTREQQAKAIIEKDHHG